MRMVGVSGGIEVTTIPISRRHRSRVIVDRDRRLNLLYAFQGQHVSGGSARATGV